MNVFIYKLAYLLKLTGWDTGEIPDELRELAETGSIPAGPVIDLGCGMGTHAIYLAQTGRDVYGVDIIPQAIEQARQRAQQANQSARAHFFTADITRLDDLPIPRCTFALDIGCFHGLPAADKILYRNSLSQVLAPDGMFLLYAFRSKYEMGIHYGMTSDSIEEIFNPLFTFEKIWPDCSWKRNAVAYLLTKRPSVISD